MLLSLLLSLAAAAHAQRVVAPVLPGPLIAAPRTAPLLPVPLQVPSVSPVAPTLRLSPAPAPSAIPVPAPKAAPAPSSKAPEAPAVDEGRASRMGEAMRTQGWLLGILSKHYGQDVVVLSLGMSMYRADLSIQDYLDILEELVAIDASAEEAEAALLHATKHTPFAKPLGPENRPDPGDYQILKMSLRELAREVEIGRNNRFMGWTYDLAAGRPTPEFSPEPEVRPRAEGTWEVRLGYLRLGEAAEPLRVIVSPSRGQAPSLAYFLDPVFASPKLSASMREALLRVRAELERRGVVVSSRP